MKKIDAVFIDIDGTLLKSDLSLDSKVKHTLNNLERMGIEIVLCTGRPFRSYHTYLQELNLNQPKRYSISFNGGAIHENETGKVVKSQVFTQKEQTSLINLATKYNVNFHFEDIKAIYSHFTTIGKYTIRDSFITEMPLKVVSTKKLAELSTINKVMFADKPATLDNFERILTDEVKTLFSIERSRPYYLEFMPQDTNKGTALTWLSHKKKYKRTLAIGDGNNDLSMLLAADYSIAMGNASDEIKKLCDFVTKSNDENGVAIALEKYIFNK